MSLNINKQDKLTLQATSVALVGFALAAAEPAKISTDAHAAVTAAYILGTFLAGWNVGYKHHKDKEQDQ